MRFSHNDYCEDFQLIHIQYMFRQNSTILKRNKYRVIADYTNCNGL